MCRYVSKYGGGGVCNQSVGLQLKGGGGGQGFKRYLSVLEGSAAASFADELLQHRSVHLPEGCRLRHLSQMIHAEPETKSLQVLEKKKKTRKKCFRSILNTV